MNHEFKLKTTQNDKNFSLDVFWLVLVSKLRIIFHILNFFSQELKVYDFQFLEMGNLRNNIHELFEIL